MRVLILLLLLSGCVDPYLYDTEYKQWIDCEKNCLEIYARPFYN
jgi:hypothetical protein